MFLNKRPTMMSLAKKKKKKKKKEQEITVVCKITEVTHQEVTMIGKIAAKCYMVGKIAAISYSGGQVFNIHFRLV